MKVTFRFPAFGGADPDKGYTEVAFDTSQDGEAVVRFEMRAPREGNIPGQRVMIEDVPLDEWRAMCRYFVDPPQGG